MCATLLGIFSHVITAIAIWDRYDNPQFACELSEGLGGEVTEVPEWVPGSVGLCLEAVLLPLGQAGGSWSVETLQGVSRGEESGGGLLRLFSCLTQTLASLESEIPELLCTARLKRGQMFTGVMFVSMEENFPLEKKTVIVSCILSKY